MTTVMIQLWDGAGSDQVKSGEGENGPILDVWQGQFVLEKGLFQDF